VNMIQHLMAGVAGMPVFVSGTMRPYLSQIAIAVSATLLAIFGSDINAAVKRVVREWPLVLRIVIFVLLVAFGYGAVTLMVSHFLAGMLMQLDDRYLSAVIVLAFVCIGALAEHKGHV